MEKVYEDFLDPAVNVLEKALKGDAGALSFLDRTASIYVFDGTNAGRPKTYGAWDFLNQALTEVERHEERSANGNKVSTLNLKYHVQLLATMSRRAARRSPGSDDNLIQTCLVNASQYHGGPTMAKHLIDLNTQMRRQVMGRIAAMTFDFSYHKRSGFLSSKSFESAFSDPVSMESLCAIVAANSVSSGPEEFVHSVLDFIIPSIDNLPPFAVASVAYHLASEAMGKGAPAGTRDVLKKTIVGPVVSKVLAPILSASVRESDVGHNEKKNSMIPQENKVNENCNHRIVSMALKALERWSVATEFGIIELKDMCQGSNIRIIEVISDALYSDAEIVVDALAELLDTITRRHSQDSKILQGLTLADSFIQKTDLNQLSSTLRETQEVLQKRDNERCGILTELISAIGLQRCRFLGRQNQGDLDVCRCLTRIAATLAIAAQSSLRSGQIDKKEVNGMLELLMKAATHPSIIVCGIALEAFPPLLIPRSDLAIRLLPILQGRAIIPPNLVGMTKYDSSNVDFHEFEKFREHVLADVLVSCYICSRSYYIESCTAAVEEFYAASPTPQLPHQLEAALYCLNAVSVDASKDALLINATSATQLSAVKARCSRANENCDVEIADILSETKQHNYQLTRCIHALAKNSVLFSSNPLSLAQTCLFLAKYANWLSKSPSEGVLDAAASLALAAFNQANSNIIDEGVTTFIIEEMTISPFAHAATALRNILSRSPERFATPEALSALENLWKESYVDANSEANKIKINDRIALCSGICRVLVILPSKQCSPSLNALAQPTIESVEDITNYTEGCKKKTGENSNDYNLSVHVLSRIAEEIMILSTMIRTFNNATSKNNDILTDSSVHPLFTVLKRLWPCLSYAAEKYSWNEFISSAMSEFLIASICIKDDSSAKTFFTDICQVATTIIKKVTQAQSVASLVPILDFIKCAIETYGRIAESEKSYSSTRTLLDNKEDKEVGRIIEQLIYLSYDSVQASYLWNDAQAIAKINFSVKIKEKKHVNHGNLDAQSGMFSILISCVQRCPVLLINLLPNAGEKGIFFNLIDSALIILNEKQSGVVRNAILFMKEVICLNIRANRANSNAINAIISTHSFTDTELNNQYISIASPLHKAVASVRGKFIMALINGSCGIFPRELLDPAASLLHAILRCTPSEVAGHATIEALQNENFILGNDAKKATIIALGKCAQDTESSFFLMDLFSELWVMHQADDAGNSIAGGDAALKYTNKYSI